MSALLAQAQQVQQQLMEAQEALANTEVHGQAGGGLVQVTMKGSGEVVAVSIDQKVVDPGDVETLQDLIVGAIADASKQVTILAHDRLGQRARRIVRARAAALVGRLQIWRAHPNRRRLGRGPFVHGGAQSLDQPFHSIRSLHGGSLFRRELDRPILDPFLPLGRLLRQQRLESDEVGQLFLVA